MLKFLCSVNKLLYKIINYPFNKRLDSFKTLEITCPVCGQIKNINIPESVFSQKKFGIIKIQVPLNAVCSEHQFIVFVDPKGSVRGYEKIEERLQALGADIKRV